MVAASARENSASNPRTCQSRMRKIRKTSETKTRRGVQDVGFWVSERFFLSEVWGHVEGQGQGTPESCVGVVKLVQKSSRAE